MKIKPSNKLKYLATEYKLGDFFRNFIAVVLGIILTFAGSDWITERNTQKEIKKSLQLVKSELLLNREEIEAMGNRVALEQRAANYLFENKDNASGIPKDSINKYFPLLFQWSKFTFTNDAIEMLKASALIQKIQNKELALQIIKAYGAIKAAETSFETYSNIKDHVQNDFNDNPKVKSYAYNLTRLREKTEDIVKDLGQQLHLLFILPEGLQLLQAIPNIQKARIYFACVEEIDKTIEAIEKECE
ncbi:hypothetical protein AALN73_04030 [Bacteroides stercorirosoris]|nr:MULTISPECIES: hypothetical protein [Bacteroides]OKZ07311.1 MAG: hypothetical protein BHV75_18005 [Bacteroides oleiciplenus]RGN40218.1 hypothetical protein DXB65_00820 [Bacteroides oleiciplenus]RGX78673.1 hypothetical protein DXA68_10595 [Bacteroides stercorirosoris]